MQIHGAAQISLSVEIGAATVTTGGFVSIQATGNAVASARY
ncbi:MAG: hypothetical protein ACLQK4_08525 [Acidimicrobiales bacterium]